MKMEDLYLANLEVFGEPACVEEALHGELWS